MRIIISAVISSIIFFFADGRGFAQNGRDANNIREELLLKGRLVKIEMAGSTNTHWFEAAVETKPGRVYILIGEPVSEVFDGSSFRQGFRDGGEVMVRGIKKPMMRVKGADTEVIEVRKIEAVEAKGD